MRTLDEVLQNKVHGLYYSKRVLLPFAANVLKAIIENDIITDFSRTKSGAQYRIKDSFTEIYFFDYPELSEVVSKYEKIKLVIVEVGKDVFDFNNHRKIGLDIQENHKVEIEEIDDDILFIE